MRAVAWNKWIRCSQGPGDTPTSISYSVDLKRSRRSGSKPRDLQPSPNTATANEAMPWSQAEPNDSTMTSPNRLRIAASWSTRVEGADKLLRHVDVAHSERRGFAGIK